MAIITLQKGKRKAFRDRIRSEYLSLYQGWKRNNPHSREYTKKKLNANIRRACGVVGKNLPIKKSTYTPWENNNWYECYYSHWYFGVILQRDKVGNIYAIVQDFHYESDHHNDTMDTVPYDESKKRRKLIIKESQLRRYIRGLIRETLRNKRMIV